MARALNKYDNIVLNLPKNQLSLRPYVINDAPINSDEDAKLQIKNLQVVINHCLQDPNGVLFLNGNLFQFSKEIFGFQRGVAVSDAVINFYDNLDRVKKVVKETLKDYSFSMYDNQDRVKEELKQIKKFKPVNSTRGNFKTFSNEDLDTFDKFSVDTKIQYFIQKLRTNPQSFKNTSFYQIYKDELIYEIQMKAYDVYIDILSFLLKPVVDNKKLAIIASNANEETKIFNFRQYDPNEKLAKKLGVPELYHNSRFWVLFVNFNNILTDFTDQRVVIAGTHIGRVNTKTGAQSRKKRAFKQFIGADMEIASSNSICALVKESSFAKDKFGNFIVKPKVVYYPGGFIKTQSTNNVELSSYVIQNPTNEMVPTLVLSRNPAYITKRIVEDGKVINFNDEYFKNLQEVTFEEIQADPQKIVEAYPYSKPYEMYASFENIKEPSKLLADAFTKRNPKRLGMAMVDLIDGSLVNILDKVEEKTEKWDNEINEERVLEFVKRFDISGKNK